MARSTWLVAGVLALAACSVPTAQPHPQTHADDVVGQPLNEVTKALPSVAPLAVQDLSVLVGKRPRFNEPDADASQWITVAVCLNADTVEAASKAEVGVVPRSAYTAAVEKKALAGGYVSNINCDDVK